MRVLSVAGSWRSVRKKSVEWASARVDSARQSLWRGQVLEHDALAVRVCIVCARVGIGGETGDRENVSLFPHRPEWWRTRSQVNLAMGAIVSTAGSCFGSCFGAAACSTCNSVLSSLGDATPKAGYLAIFALGIALTVLLRETGGSLLAHLPLRSQSGHDSLHAALRSSQGPFLLFASLCVSLLNTKARSSFRARWLHGGLWLPKAALLLVLTLGVFWLAPDSEVHVFVPVARLLGSVFLVLQMVILVDFAYEWSESWASTSDDRWFLVLLILTTAFYGCSITLHALSLKWFNPPTAEQPCRLNLALTSLSLIFTVGLIPLCLLPSAREGALFPSSIVSMYAAATLYAALSSEPSSSTCIPHWLVPQNHPLAESDDVEHTKRPGGVLSALVTYGNLVFTCLCVLYSVSKAGTSGVLGGAASADDDGSFGTGEETEELLPRSHSAGGATSNTDEETAAQVGTSAEEAERESSLDYSPSLFHGVFACAFAYIAMILTDWGTSSLDEGQLSVGWSSFAVKAMATFVVIGLHAWSIVAPAIFPNREFA